MDKGEGKRPVFGLNSKRQKKAPPDRLGRGFVLLFEFESCLEGEPSAHLDGSDTCYRADNFIAALKVLCASEYAKAFSRGIPTVDIVPADVNI